MIARAYIVESFNNGNNYKVRIPIYDGDGITGTNNDSLTIASVMCIPGIEINYQIGDVVFVAFEDDNIGKPVIIGYLKSALKNTTTDATFKNLEATYFKTPSVNYILSEMNN